MAVLDLCINNYLEIAKRNIDAEEPASEVGAICVKEQHMLFERANKKQCSYCTHYAEEPASEVGAICVKEQHMLFERANKKQCSYCTHCAWSNQCFCRLTHV